jgi:excisionase family DNA binding protein
MPADENGRGVKYMTFTTNLMASVLAGGRSLWHSLRALLRDKSGDMPVSTMFLGLPDILTIEHLQQALNIGRTTAYRLISSGAIKHWKIGKMIKVPKVFLIDYIADSCYNGGVAADSPSQGGSNI